MLRYLAKYWLLDIKHSPWGKKARRLAGSLLAKLGLNFEDESYRVDGAQSDFATSLTHSASTNATMTSGYGPELVTNGTFDTDSDWTLGAGWSISGGVAYHPSGGGGSDIRQNLPMVDGRTYLISLDVVSLTGSAISSIRVNAVVLAANITQSGTYEYVYTKTASETGDVIVLANNLTECTIDNISVREMPAIKWRPHNIVKDSQALDDQTYWSRISSGTGVSPTVTTGFTDPDGGTGAFRLQGSRTGSGFSLLQQNLTGVDSTQHTSAVWMKSNTGSDQIIYFRGQGTNIETVTSEWQLFELTENITSSTSYISIGSRDLAPTSEANYDILVYAPHVYRSDLGGMVDNPDRGDSYVPTTSSAVYLPRRGHHIYNGYEWVNEGMLHESEARTNLEPYSKIDSGWNAAGLTSLTADVAISPTGVQDATEIIENATGGSHYVYRDSSFTTSNVDNTFSAYVKRGSGSRHIQLRAFYLGPAAPYVNFDLENGVVGTTSGASGTTSSGHTWTLSNTNMDDVGNGWYRISATVNASTGFGFGLYLTDSTTAAESYAYTGDGTSSLYIWNAQTEEASTPSSPIPTFGATVTRAAESLTIPAANLPWPTPNVIGSELVTNGTFDTDVSGWTVSAGLSATVSSGQVTLTNDTGFTAYSENIQQTVSGLVVGKVYRFSFDYVSGTNRIRVSWSAPFKQIYSDVATSFTFVATATSGTLVLFLDAINLGDNATIDNISVKEIDPLAVSIQMNGRMTYADTNAAAEVHKIKWEADFNNRIWWYMPTSTGTGQQIFLQVSGGTGDSVATSATYYSPGVFVPFNIASRHGSTFINGAVDGVALTANTTPTALPDLSATDLSLGYDFMGTIQNFQIWDRDIGDTGLVDETAPSLEPSLFLTFDGTTGSYTVTDWSE